MNNAPTFSVIIPTYNQAEYLVLALESLLAQTDPDWEALVVNDGSTDSTADVITDFERRDPRIKGFHKTNGGTGSALNHGLRNASARWICWLSSDDLFVPRKLEIHREWISREPATEFFHTHFQTIDASGTVLESPPHWRNMPAREGQVLEMLRSTYVHGLGICVRRDAMLAAGGFDERFRYAQDYDLWLRLLTKHAATFVPERTCVQRYHAGQTTNTFPEACFYDSSRAAIELLNTHTFAELCPFANLNDLETAEKAITQAIDVASSFESPFLYGLGPHALLLWRIVEWVLASEDAGATEHLRKRVAARVRSQLRKGNVHPSLLLQWKSALAVLQMDAGDFHYSAVSPFEIGRMRRFALRSDPTSQSEAFVRYVSKLGDDPACLDERGTAPLSFGEVVIVCQRGARVDAKTQFGAARSQITLAHHFADSGVQVLLVGNAGQRYGHVEGIPFIGLKNDNELPQVLRSLSPHDALIGISRADIFEYVSAARPLVYQHGPFLPEGKRALAIIRRHQIPVIVVSQDSLETQVRYGVPGKQLHLVPNGYDVRLFAPPSPDARLVHRIIFAGNGIAYKGSDIAVRAFEILKREFRDAEFQLFGSTHESQTNEVHEWPGRWLDADGRVRWCAIQTEVPGITHFGEVSQHRLAEALGQASILVMPSRIPETFGLVSIEAQASGCVPVLPRSGGFPETMLEGVTGYLYDDNTPEKLAETIGALWRNGLPTITQREQAVAWVRTTFPSEKSCRAIERVIDALVPRPTRAADVSKSIWTIVYASRKRAGRLIAPLARRIHRRQELN